MIFERFVKTKLNQNFRTKQCTTELKGYKQRHRVFLLYRFLER